MPAAHDAESLRVDALPSGATMATGRTPAHRQARLHLALLLACTVLLVPLPLGLQRSAAWGGDAPFYWAMQQALLQHGWPSIPDDIASAVAAIEHRPNLDGEGRLIAGRDGARYPVHFWFYSLLSLPFAWLLQLAGVATIHAFPLLNIAAFAAAAWTLRRSTALRPVGKSVALVSFAATTILWYLPWSHPEAFTACLLLMASLALLERRHARASLLTALASLQNPSAILLLGAVAAVAIDEAVRGAEPGRLRSRLLDRAIRIAGGGAIALLPYAYGLAVLGVTNPILANGYVDFGQLTAGKLLSLLFDWNQGFVIAFPFLLTVLAAVFFARLRRFGWRGLVRIEDTLLLGMLAMALPVLTQVNFNAGQFYASRYLSWLAAPGIVWAALQVQGIGARPALRAWFLGFGLYAVNFALFFAQKVHYVLTVARAGGLPYEDQLVMKPAAALLLAMLPAAYDPWPEIFIERSLHRELSVAEIREGQVEVVGYPGGGRSFTKVLTREPDWGFVAARLCPGQEAVAEGSGTPRFTPAGLGYFYLDGAAQCRARTPRSAPRQAGT